MNKSLIATLFVAASFVTVPTSFVFASEIPNNNTRVAQILELVQSVSTLGPIDYLANVPPDKLSGTLSNVLKTKHDTVKNSISNIR